MNGFEILIWVCCLVLAASSIGKFLKSKSTVSAFKTWNVDQYRLLAGVVELSSAISMAIPATRPYGVLVGSLYLGCAFAIPLSHGEWKKGAPALLVAGLIWFGWLSLNNWFVVSA